MENINWFKTTSYNFDEQKEWKEGEYTYQLIPNGEIISQKECDDALVLSKKKRLDPDKNNILSQATSAVFHISLLLCTLFFTPKLNSYDEDQLTNDQVYFLTQALMTTAEKEEDLSKAENHDVNNVASNIKDNVDGKQTKSSSYGSLSSVVKQVSSFSGREDALQQAANFGMIDLVKSFNTTAGSSPWGKDISLNNSDPSFWVNEIPGEGSLSLSGIGEIGGAGGKDIIGVGRIGGAFGDNIGGILARHRQLKEHEVKAPVLRAGTTSVSGPGIPSGLVQRTVRQNFGRFRSCYENGLRTNPNLSGRVVSRFVIGHDGSVASVKDGGSDLPSGEVISCVTRAFYGLSFPAPTNAGVVTVIYPIMFNPG